MDEKKCVCVRMPSIGVDVVKFRAKTTMEEITFPNDYKGKWVK